MLNLLINAIKFTRKGKIAIKVKYFKRIDKLKISVSDTGIGVPLENQKLIFELFG